jgi:transglutaminase-like putative cysteine protease
MQSFRRKLESYRDTVSEVYRLARSYSSDIQKPFYYTKQDLCGIAQLCGTDLKAGRWRNLFHFYDYVRSLPYHPDPVGLETVSRPLYTLNPEWTGPRDCDDKTILIMAYCHLNNIPARAVVVGKGLRPHHIYPEVFIHDTWQPADATYPDSDHDCRFGKRLYNENFREVFEP